MNHVILLIIIFASSFASDKEPTFAQAFGLNMDIMELAKNKKLFKFKDYECKVIKYCEKRTNCNYCKEWNGQCDQFDLKNKSYTGRRDFKTGDVVIISDSSNHLKCENVFKKRIYKSKTKFYTSCSFPTCFNEQENDRDYCKYHDDSPFLTKEDIFQKIRLKVATNEQKSFLLETIMKYENNLNSLTTNLYYEFFDIYNQPSWWPKSIEFGSHSLFKNDNLEQLIILAYKYYNKESNLDLN